MTSNPSRTLRVAAVSPEIRIGDPDANLTALRSAISAADADLVVAPELALSGYVFADRAEAEALALTSAELDDVVSSLPTGRDIVFGVAERDGAALYNSAVVVSGGSIVGCYRKSHLWDAEKTVFSPGDRAGAVFELDGYRLAVAICYDNEFPEVPRALALQGADLLALPVNWPLVSRPNGEHAPETIQAMAAARSSRLPTVIADRHGIERGVDWTGGTAVIDADGWIAAAHPHGTSTTLTLPGADKRIGPHNDLFGDRRPELYRAEMP